LSPFDPLAFFYAFQIAVAHLAARRFEQRYPSSLPVPG